MVKVVMVMMRVMGGECFNGDGGDDGGGGARSGGMVEMDVLLGIHLQVFQ